MNESGATRIILLTNIDYVTIEPVRMHASAVVLTHDDRDLLTGSQRDKLSVFGVDGAWPVADVELREGIDYEISDVKSSHVFTGEDNEPRPLATGHFLTWPDLVASVTRADYERPLCRDEFEIPAGDTHDEEWNSIHALTYERLWNMLRWRAAMFWRAPYMPVLTHRGVQDVAKACEQLLASA